MKGKRLLSILGQADERYIQESAPAGRTVKNRIWIRWGVAAVCIAIAAIVCIPMLYSSNDDIPPGIEVKFGGISDRRVYYNLQDMEEESGIVVEAIPRKVLGQEVNPRYFYDKEKDEVKKMPDYGYTKWEIEVTKVYKGDVEVGDKLVFLHEYYIWTYEDGREVLYTFSSRKPEVKNNKYIMFLIYYEPLEGYCTVGDYEAVFRVPTEKMKEKVKEGTVEQSDFDVYDRDDMHFLIPIFSEVVEKYFN